jgi:hypothetical protein
VGVAQLADGDGSGETPAKVQRRRGTFHNFDFFGDACRLVGGIHQPKLVEAHGSDEPKPLGFVWIAAGTVTPRASLSRQGR